MGRFEEQRFLPRQRAFYRWHSALPDSLAAVKGQARSKHRSSGSGYETIARTSHTVEIPPIVALLQSITNAHEVGPVTAGV